MPRARDSEDELWAQEVAYWDALKRADLTGCLSFLHDDVVAWPNGRSAPVTKDAIFQMLVAILPTLRPGSLAVELTRRSVRAWAEVGIVCYEVHLRFLPGGGWEPVNERCLHAWARTGDGWKIIGGMTAPLGPREA